MWVRSQPGEALIQVPVVEEVRAVFLLGLLPRVVHLVRVAVLEAPVQARLQRVVPVVPAVAEEVDALRPADTLRRSHRRSSGTGRRRMAAAGRAGYVGNPSSVGSLTLTAGPSPTNACTPAVADVAHLDRHHVAQLTLNGDVERVHRRRPLLRRKRAREHAFLAAGSWPFDGTAGNVWRVRPTRRA